MTDRSKLPIHRVDGLQNELNTIETDISTVNTKLNTTLNFNNITNCLIEIPQNIKIDFNSNGTITLKAGSKLYYPDGKNADGTNKFGYRIINKDIISNFSTNSIGNNWFITLTTISESLGWYDITQMFADDSPPTIPSNNSPHNYWYDTLNNIIKVTADKGVTWSNKACFPICNLNLNNGVVTKINQIYKAMGYISSICYILPEVKGLIPNGLTEYGTLNNIIQNVNTVLLKDYKKDNLLINKKVDLTLGLNLLSVGNMIYDVSNNYMYKDTITPDRLRHEISIANVYTDTTRIISFEPVVSANLLSYSDSDWIAKQNMPSEKFINLTLDKTGATYTAPATGYFCFNKRSGAAGCQIVLHHANTSVSASLFSSSSEQLLRLYLPVQKGQKIIADYSGTFSSNIAQNYFRFIYAEGAK